MWQSERKTALIYEQVLEQVLVGMELMVLTNRAVRPDAVRTTCPACRAGDDREHIYLDLLARAAVDPMVQVALATADPLCQEHFASLLARCTDAAVVQRVIHRQYRSLETVDAMLGTDDDTRARKRG